MFTTLKPLQSPEYTYRFINRGCCLGASLMREECVLTPHLGGTLNVNFEMRLEYALYNHILPWVRFFFYSITTVVAFEGITAPPN